MRNQKCGGKRHQSRGKRGQGRTEVKAGGCRKKRRHKESCLSKTRTDRRPCRGDAQKKTWHRYTSEGSADGGGAHARGVETETWRSKRKANTTH